MASQRREYIVGDRPAVTEVLSIYLPLKESSYVSIIIIRKTFTHIVHIGTNECILQQYKP